MLVLGIDRRVAGNGRIGVAPNGGARCLHCRRLSCTRRSAGMLATVLSISAARCRAAASPGSQRRPGRLPHPTGVTADGRRSAVVSMSTQLGDSWDTVLAHDGSAGALIDHALCHAAWPGRSSAWTTRRRDDRGRCHQRGCLRREGPPRWIAWPPRRRATAPRRWSPPARRHPASPAWATAGCRPI